MQYLSTYKYKYHFLVNFYSFFLLTTFIPDVLGIPAGIVTNGIWLLRAVMAVLLIYTYRRGVTNFSRNEKLFLVVSLIYFISLFIDIYFEYFPVGLGNPRDLIGFLLSILVALSFRKDSLFSSRSSYFYFIITLALGLLVAFFLAVPSPAPLVGRFDANSTVNTIIYGKTGCALSIVAIYGLRNFKFRFSTLIYIVFFLLGILSIMRAGSRSPVVILLGVLLFYFFANFNLVKGVLVVAFLSIVLWFSLSLLIQLSEYVGSDIVSRLLASIEGGDTSGRDEIYKNVLGLIAESPVFGSFYLIPSGVGKGFYPHNYFLEAFMTTGFVGGIPFILMVFVALKKSYKLLRMKHETGWIVLLFLQAFFYGMFSSNLYSAEDFWGLCFLVLSANVLSEKKIKEHRRNAPLEVGRYRGRRQINTSL